MDGDKNIHVIYEYYVLIQINLRVKINNYFFMIFIGCKASLEDHVYFNTYQQLKCISFCVLNLLLSLLTASKKSMHPQSFIKCNPYDKKKNQRFALSLTIRFKFYVLRNTLQIVTSTNCLRFE